MVTSYNGWNASPDPKAIDVDPGFTAAGRKFPGGVKRGPVSVIFRYLIEQFDKRVEELDAYTPGDEWGYNYRVNRNAANLSCHASGTAVDLNATKHPNGKRGTFRPIQVAAIRTILDELDGVVRWGGDFTGTVDEMHFEVKGTPTAVARVAGRLLSAGPAKPDPVKPPEEDDMPKTATCTDSRGQRWFFWLEGQQPWARVNTEKFALNVSAAKITGDLAAVAGKEGTIDLYGTGTDGKPWVAHNDGSGWGPWQAV